MLIPTDGYQAKSVRVQFNGFDSSTETEVAYQVTFPIPNPNVEAAIVAAVEAMRVEFETLLNSPVTVQPYFTGERLGVNENG